MVRSEPTIIELDMGKLEELLGRIDSQDLRADDYAALHALIESYVGLFHAVGNKTTTITRLRQMLFGAKTEKTSAVLGGLKKGENAAGRPPFSAASAAAATDMADRREPPLPSAEPIAAAKVDARGEADAKAAEGTDKEGDSSASNHGRNGASAYTSAEKIEVPHPSLEPGDPCPKCEKGTVYDTKRPGVLVRLTGQPPVDAKVYYLQKLRCNLCNELFTAERPAGIGEAKYDATVGSMIAFLRYGMGMPLNRNEMLQESLGVPLPDATQWEIVADQAEHVEPAFEELIRQAAQGDVVHNDDTTVKILELMEHCAQQEAFGEDRRGELAEDAVETVVEAECSAKPADAGAGYSRSGSACGSHSAAKKRATQRKGMFTTGIVTEVHGGQRIALFLSGHQHAGENLKDVLKRRAADLPPPIQMCDALSRNKPQGVITLLGNCLTHGRRKFVDVAEQFPEECQHVLESIAAVYHNDAITKERGLSLPERLLFHQAESGPVMEELHVWLGRQFEERRVEPNSTLGASITYMLRHWQELTLFLRVAGAPLDNNICEQALKMAIRHRKNSLFYKTTRGAHVGDIFMSLIHTCRLCGANPFDYLTELDRHAEEVASNPAAWMPWSYRQTLAADPAPASPAL